MATLILSLDGLVLKEFHLDKPRITIGRRLNNDIQIDNPAISGEHAAIVTILSDSFVEDLDSTNGTMVNGRVVKKQLLRNNDVIEMAKYRLKYLNDPKEENAEAEDALQFEPSGQTYTVASSFSRASTPPLASTPPPSTPPASPTPVSPAPATTSRPGPSGQKSEAAQLLGTVSTVRPLESIGGPLLPDPLFPPTLPQYEEENRRPQDLTAQGENRRPQGQGQGQGQDMALARSMIFRNVESFRGPPVPEESPAGAPKAVMRVLNGNMAGYELPLTKEETTFGKPGVQVVKVIQRPQGYFISHVEGAPLLINGIPLSSRNARNRPLKEREEVLIMGVKMALVIKS